MDPTSLTPASPARPLTASTDPAPTRVFSASQLKRYQTQIRRTVCSAAWFDECWAAVCKGRVSLKRALRQEIDRIGLYPPGGSGNDSSECATPSRRPTLMRRCHACDAWYPPQYLRGDTRCEDCHAASEIPRELAQTDHRTHRTTTSSPTAMALRQLEHYGLRLIQRRLIKANPGTLTRQVKRYLKMQKTTKIIVVQLNATP